MIVPLLITGILVGHVLRTKKASIGRRLALLGSLLGGVGNVVNGAILYLFHQLLSRSNSIQMVSYFESCPMLSMTILILARPYSIVFKAFFPISIQIWRRMFALNRQLLFFVSEVKSPCLVTILTRAFPATESAIFVTGEFFSTSPTAMPHNISV